MKILLLCWRDTTHPQGGGSERYLERVGGYLASQGHEVVFRTSKHMNAARREVRDGVRYSRGGAKFGVYPRAWAAMLAGVDAHAAAAAGRETRLCSPLLCQLLVSFSSVQASTVVSSDSFLTCCSVQLTLSNSLSLPENNNI